jgi:hypothetical protein
MKNLNKRGGKGILSLGCLPLWGERGSPSWLPQRISELQRKRGFQQSQNSDFFKNILPSNRFIP